MTTGLWYREGEIIKRAERAFRVVSARGKPGGLRLGIGDDAAVFRPVLGQELVLSCDNFLEGVHFLAALHPPESVGYKSLVRAASDLAAMGAKPRCFLLSLAIPRRLTGRWMDKCFRGMSRAARRMGMELAGGDTAADSKAAISITAMGEVPQGRAVTRSGARPGEVLCVTGRLGGAQLGLELLRNGAGSKQILQKWLAPHLFPPIRIEIGCWLARHRLATAMIDVSDGLSTDLARLCEASGFGARVYADRIPCVAPPARSLGNIASRVSPPPERALHGGDDYELLFTVPPSRLREISRLPRGVKVTPIGEITRDSEIFLVDSNGHARVLPAGGWEHFPASRQSRGR